MEDIRLQKICSPTKRRAPNERVWNCGQTSPTGIESLREQKKNSLIFVAYRRLLWYTILFCRVGQIEPRITASLSKTIWHVLTESKEKTHRERLALNSKSLSILSSFMCRIKQLLFYNVVCITFSESDSLIEENVTITFQNKISYTRLSTWLDKM